jgi:hypothetical protein
MMDGAFCMHQHQRQLTLTTTSFHLIPPLSSISSHYPLSHTPPLLHSNAAVLPTVPLIQPPSPTRQARLSKDIFLPLTCHANSGGKARKDNRKPIEMPLTACDKSRTILVSPHLRQKKRRMIWWKDENA